MFPPNVGSINTSLFEGWLTNSGEKRGFKTGYNLRKLYCVISSPTTSAHTVELNDWKARAKLFALILCIKCQNENSLNSWLVVLERREEINFISTGVHVISMTVQI